MSAEASDIPTDEDFEDLVEDGLSLTQYMSDSGKRTRKKKTSGKPPLSPRSPYLSSMNMNPKRATLAAWRPLRGTQGGTQGERGNSLGESSTARTPRESWLASLNNGHGLSQTVRSEYDSTHTRLSSSPCTPEYLKQALGMRKPKHSRSSSNGYTPGTPDYREKEDMYDEIIHLKKSLQAQKSDNDKMKAKLRRLEEDKTKKDRQIEQLLEPTKGPEYTRSLVDKKSEGSAVLNGLKQRILKLEQQCREKENTLTKLQSELRTTNMQELKITVETYFEEIHRLRMLLETAEKSSRAESKGSQRQQKVLSSTVLRLTENQKQLQQENHTLREELNTDSPAGGVKGYREWSKQRLLRRLIELERRLEEGKKAPVSGKRSRLDRSVQTDHLTTPTQTEDVPREVTVSKEPEVAVGTAPVDGEELLRSRGRVSQLEKERGELQDTLTNRDEEVKRLTEEREKAKGEAVRWKDEQTKEREKETRQHKQEMERLSLRIQTLEGRLEREGKKNVRSSEEPSPPSPPENQEQNPSQENQPENQREGEGERREEEEEEEREERERAARVIQRQWLEHRDRDTVLLQSALRGHLLRERQLTHLRNLQAQGDTHVSNHDKGGQSVCSSDVTSSVEGDGGAEVAVTLIQSVFRGHLTRSGLSVTVAESPAPPPCRESSVPTPAPRRTHPAHTHSSTGPIGLSVSNEEITELSEDPWPVSNTFSFKKKLTPAQLELHPRPDSEVAKAMDSDDSDDIIVSPSRPLRHRDSSYF